jgi:hypothetical protein
MTLYRSLSAPIFGQLQSLFCLANQLTMEATTESAAADVVSPEVLDTSTGASCAKKSPEAFKASIRRFAAAAWVDVPLPKNLAAEWTTPASDFELVLDLCRNRETSRE